MKTLILGNGAREHALAWLFSRSRRNCGLFCMPGNAGTADLAVNLPGDPADPAAVLEALRLSAAELVVVGPEAPLAAGVADAIRAAGVPVFGPGKDAARLESSKAFARALSDRAGVPSARTARFDRFKDFDAWLSGKAPAGSLPPYDGRKVVLKKSGLAAGKGVLESDDRAGLRAFGKAVLDSDELLAEEFLEGFELSVFAVSDGSRWLVLPACADHKKALAGNLGPNTGGMGAVCPVPSADAALMDRIGRDIVAPSFARMAEEGLSYRGVLFFGVMVTKDGPKLLEYNVRFGDPETQSLAPLLATDPVDLFASAAAGNLSGATVEFYDGAAVGVTVAAPGYPGACPRGIKVRGLPRETPGQMVFHAGTARDEVDALVTGGGRCFTAVGVGADFFEARALALEAARRVEFEGAWFRPDIGTGFFMDGR